MLPALAAVLMAFAGAGCASLPDLAARLIAGNRVHDLELFRFDPSTPLIDRVQPAPPHAPKYLQELDERPDYRSYRPNAAERAKIQLAINELPPRLARNLRERGLGLYFIDDFLTSGMTDFAVDRQSGELYSFMIFHRDSLRKDVDTLLTEREAPAFRDAGSGKVYVTTGTYVSAFTYLLLHEATHALDYSRRIGPYVEEHLEPLQSRQPRAEGLADLIDDVWAEYREPRAGSDFDRRDKISFYGFRKGPHLRYRQAVPLYTGLINSPFVSLYGAQMMPEDIAELVSMYWLTRKQPDAYIIRVQQSGSLMVGFQPMLSKKIRRRVAGLKQALQ